MAEEMQRRQIARKLWIRDILGGAYIKEEGFKPNYVLLKDNSRAARVNLLGIAVSVSSEGLPTIVLDDGTGRINVRAFEPSEKMSKTQIGDALLVVGKPRQFNMDMYVLPEIIKKLPDLGWLEVRKRELAASPIVSAETAPVPKAAASDDAEEMVVDSFSNTEKILDAIRQLDAGAGADTEQVIVQIGARDAEKTIQFLLQNGDVFEISPGKLKVLE
jgi:RPA family protein